MKAEKRDRYTCLHTSESGKRRPKEFNIAAKSTKNLNPFLAYPPPMILWYKSEILPSSLFDAMIWK